MVSLHDHLVKRRLDGLTDPIQATLQGPTPSIRYYAASEYNEKHYEDRAGFEGFAAKLSDESKGMADLEEIDRRGNELIASLYAYRSIARALPTVTGSEDNKRAIYAASFEVLHPYIGLVKQLMYFKEDVVSRFCQSVQLLVRSREDKKGDPSTRPCEGLMMQLLRALDTLVVLDSLKDTKACFNNDFATYKRAFQLCRNEVAGADQIASENNLLQPFLANNMVLLGALKTAVNQIDGHEDTIAAMAVLCLECLEQEWYLLPAEKHRLLRGSAYLLWLLDGGGEKAAPHKSSAFRHRLIRRERFARWLKLHPVVPLYGDMHANLHAVLQRCPSFAQVDAADWLPLSKKDELRAQQAHDLASHLPRRRALVAEYIGALNELLHRVSAMGGGRGCRLPREEHTDLAMRLTWCVLRGCRLMCLTAAQLSEFVAWKCAHTASDEQLARRAAAGYQSTEYEQALRFNLSDAEKTGMVEMVGLLKGLHAALHQVEGDPEIMIRRALHEQTQLFVHSVMGGPTRKAVKYDKKIKPCLLQLRSMAADWSDGVAATDEGAMCSKEFKQSSHRSDYPARSVPPSDTQLWLLRSLVRSLSDESSPAVRSGLGREADLPKQTVGEMRAFYASTALFPYLLRLPATLQALSNVSYLWLREFYLELAKRSQFPASMSLPWILTEHVLAQRNGPLMPMLLTCMDAYNDAAADALRAHKQQHLYMEIEAEVNLCFDQVLFSLAEQVYTHFKTRASLMLAVGGAAPRPPGSADPASDPHAQQAARALGKSWYDALLSQRGVQLLGRSVDLGLLLGQRMNTMLRTSIHAAVARFEAKDLTAVLELRELLRVAQLTQALLTRALPGVDPFDALLAEANEQAALLSFSSRIASHALGEAVDDLLPNFAFRLDDHLFQRPPKTDFTEPPEREPAPKVSHPSHLFGTKQLNAEFAMKCAGQHGLFGAVHAEALVEVLGEAGMQLLLSRLTRHMQDLLAAFGSYVSAVQEAMPPNTKTPSHQYGAAGCYGYYEAKLLDLRSYEELHSGVLQSCRRLGNAVLLLQLLEGAGQVGATKTLLQLPPTGALGNDVPRPLRTAADSVAKAWGQSPDESDMSLMARQLSTLCAPLSPSASLLNGALAQLAAALSPQREQWLGGDGPTADMATYESTLAFHRVWSAVQFLFCTANVETHMGNLGNLMFFGEGVPVAGCLILHMLGQQHRFRLFDFCAHVCAVAEASAPPLPPGGAPADPAMQAFLSCATNLYRANERVFTMLQALDVPTVYTVDSGGRGQ